MAKMMIERILEIMNQYDRIRNMGIIAHIDHGKTTLSDNLIAGAGMISKELAGQLCVLDFHEDEKERGITIDAANVSMIHNLDGQDYLINLIDTPGHVDFGGDVTRAMRAVDGAVVVCCAVEGTMPQTETVLRQALRERVRPILYINKVDRLIREVKLTPEAMQARFMEIIKKVNQFIYRYAPEEFKEKWQVNVLDGSVVFGSAFHNWALSVPYMQKNKISFKDVIDAYTTNEENAREILREKAPLHVVLLNSVIKHFPNPKEAQAYRIPHLWHGDLESEEGKALINADPNGPAVFVATKIVVDPHAGEVITGRLFSGKLKPGMEVYLLKDNNNKFRIQQVFISNGPKRELVEEVDAGNIVGITGVKDCFAGDTVATKIMQPFEEIKHIFDPVVTKAISAKKPGDLPKLVEVLKQVHKEDPSLKIEINEETGQHLISGMGELHLEVIENRIKREKNVDVVTSPPIVVYRETVRKESPLVEGKSPNKHNKFYIRVMPLKPEMLAIVRELPNQRVNKFNQDLINALQKGGMSYEEAKKVKAIHNANIFVEATRGIVHIGEVIEMVIDMFEDVMKQGPLAREPGFGMKVVLEDAILHEDSIHRGPGQVYPAVRDAIKQAMLEADPVLFEPVQVMQFEAPSEYMGAITKLINAKRGVVLNIDQDEYRAVIEAKLPVAETFGLSAEFRSATGGRGTFFVIDQLFEMLPFELQQKIIKQIRDRKGLAENQL
ncbi:MAG: elongation factor EF-2 [Candidatus Woesearchaeota archaeon]